VTAFAQLCLLKGFGFREGASTMCIIGALMTNRGVGVTVIQKLNHGDESAIPAILIQSPNGIDRLGEKPKEKPMSASSPALKW